MHRSIHLGSPPTNRDYAKLGPLDFGSFESRYGRLRASLFMGLCLANLDAKRLATAGGAHA